MPKAAIINNKCVLLSVCHVLTLQSEQLLGLVHERHGALVDNGTLSARLQATAQAAAVAGQRAHDAEARSVQLSKELDFYKVCSGCCTQMHVYR